MSSKELLLGVHCASQGGLPQSLEVVVKLIGQVSLQQVAYRLVSDDAAALSVETTIKLVWQVSLQQVACGVIRVQCYGLERGDDCQAGMAGLSATSNYRLVSDDAAA